MLIGEESSSFLSTKLKIVACIPAWNEESTIAKVIVRTLDHVDEIIVVDDGSTDDTARIAVRLGARVVSHRKNMGYGAAIQSCFEAAREAHADVMVTLDADRQHDPDEIPNLIGPILKNESDVVIGSRFHERSIREIPTYRQAGLKMLNQVTNAVATQKVTDSQSGFRGYSREAIELLYPDETGMGVSSQIVVKAGDAGLKISEIPVAIKYKGLRKPTRSPIAHGYEVLISILRVAAEKHPFLFLGLPGVILVMGGVYGWFWVFVTYSVYGIVATGTALVSSILVLVGSFAINTTLILFVVSDIFKKMR